MRREVICGIYKITSPTGKIYIGESKDILKRWVSYKNLSCKGQGKILNSLKKYTPEKHTFEIIERCEFNELKCRERYWQDFYNVLNEGLNLKLTKYGELKEVVSEETIEKIREAKMGEKNPMFGKRGELHPNFGIKKTPEEIERRKQGIVFKRGEEHPSWGSTHTEETKDKISKAKKGKQTGWESAVAEPVINTQTEEIYPSATEAFNFSGMESYDYFKSKLNGGRTNDTYFMYYKDYEKYGALEPKEIKIIKQEVIDTLTLKKYSSISEAAKDLGIRQTNLTRYLSGDRPNTTYCVYEKDYVEGVIHHPVEARPKLKVEDWSTNTIYKDSQEASEKTGININTLRSYLSGSYPNAERNTFKYYTEE